MARHSKTFLFAATAMAAIAMAGATHADDAYLQRATRAT